MTIKYGQKVLTYYGPSGHKKDLVDAMSAFEAKGPLYRAVVSTILHVTHLRKSLNTWRISLMLTTKNCTSIFLKTLSTLE